jgi:hypothetical protein
MKKFLGIAAITLLASIPAFAQSKGGSIGSSSSAILTSSGGSVGGASIVGTSTRLSNYGRAQFATAAFSGGDSSFAPSAFLTFEQAIELGKLESAPRKSVAEAAAENLTAIKAKSRTQIVQDNGGNLVPVPR